MQKVELLESRKRKVTFFIKAIKSVYWKPILKIIGITKDNFQPVVYWMLYIVIGFIFYQLLLVIFAWLFGQFKFFWDFEKKMLKRMKLGFLLNEK